MKPPRDPISTQARGQLRQLWIELSADADRIEAAGRRVPATLARDARRKFGRGADRAMAAIERSIPVAAMPRARYRRGAGWRFLRPLAGSDRPGVAVMLLTLNGEARPGFHVQPFGLTGSLHALGRLLDRTNFRGDPAQALLAAHDRLLDLAPAEGFRLFNLERFLVPAGPGAFLMRTSSVDTEEPMAVAATWVADDQLFTDQQQDANAWARLTQPASNFEGLERS